MQTQRALHTCDLPHSYVRHDSGSVLNASGSMPCSYTWHVTFIIWHTCFICVICLIHTWDMTQVLCSMQVVICLAHTRDMSHSYMWHALLICVTWFIHTCDVPRSYVGHDSGIVLNASGCWELPVLHHWPFC